jgi:hypothetical protein
MCNIDGDNTKLLQKFWNLYRNVDGQKYSARGGIFSTKTRERLLGVKRPSGRGITKSRFWSFNRRYVKNALLDLQLFIETADRHDVNKVIKRTTLQPILDALLNSRDEPDSTRALIAQLLIETGFRYLMQMNRRILLKSQTGLIDESIQFSKQLTGFLLPEKERALFVQWGTFSEETDEEDDDE